MPTARSSTAPAVAHTAPTIKTPITFFIRLSPRSSRRGPYHAPQTPAMQFTLRPSDVSRTCSARRVSRLRSGGPRLRSHLAPVADHDDGTHVGRSRIGAGRVHGRSGHRGLGWW